MLFRSSGHELLLSEGEDLASDETGDTCPAQNAEQQHQVEHSDIRINSHLIHHRTQNYDDGHCGDAVEHVDKTHYHVVDPAAEVAGDTAEDNTYEGGYYHYDESDNEGYSAAVHEAGEHIHTVTVGAEPMLGVGFTVAVVLRGLGVLLNVPLFVESVVLKLVLKLLAVFVGVIERDLTAEVVGADLDRKSTRLNSSHRL